LPNLPQRSQEESSMRNGLTGIAALIPHQIINHRSWTCDYCFSMLYDCNCPQNVMCEECHSEPDDADLTEKCDHSDDGKHHWRGQVGDGTETIQPVSVS
jgi:hypothetical protein